MTEERYSSPRAVENAIRSAARNRSTLSPSVPVSDRIRQEHFRRFLSRVFSDKSDPGWMLKGGTGVLARLESARATRDVDLFRRSHTVEDAIGDLRRMAEIDLGDFFHFEYTGHRLGIGGTQQAGVNGGQISFDIYVGQNKRGVLNVDLVIEAVTTDETTLASPANALDLPKLRSSPYRLYSVVDQIADKICATLSNYNGSPSTREWDLVDLVILASTEPISSGKLWRALTAEAEARSIEIPQNFSVPAQWGRRYTKEAKSIPACANFRTIEAAKILMNQFIDPVLRGEVDGKSWDPSAHQWQA